MPSYRYAIFLLLLAAPCLSVANDGNRKLFEEALERGVDFDDAWDFRGDPEALQTLISNGTFNNRTLAPAADRGGSRGDLSLSAGYKLFTPVTASGNAQLRRACFQTDGKLLLTGMVTPAAGTEDAGIVRIDVDGTYDATFGTNGMLLVNAGNAYDRAHGMALQTDGKIVVVGKSDRGNTNRFDVLAARLTTGGSLDTSFATTGVKTFSVDSNGEVARAVALQTDGKIIVAGYAWYYSYNHSFVARLNTDGAIDTTFGVAGILLTSFSKYTDGVVDVVVLPDGKIAAASSYESGAGWDVGISKINTNGTLDTSFQTDGKFHVSFGTANDQAQAMVLDTSGRLVVGGSASNGGNLDWMVARFFTDGSLDTSFRTRGYVINTLNTANEEWQGIRLQSDGKIVTVGTGTAGTGTRMYAARYTSDGQLDTTFGTTGMAYWAHAGGTNLAGAIDIGDGVIFGGGWESSGTYSWSVARFATDGSYGSGAAGAVGFGAAGLFTIDFGTGDAAYAINRQTDGTLLVAGSNGVDIALARVTAAGALDTSFRTTGKVTLNLQGADEARGMTIQTDGRIVLAGSNGSLEWALARFMTDGQLDTSFRTVGYGTTTSFAYGNNAPYAVLQDLDGTLVAVGASGHAVALARYRSDGSLETAFATTGRVLTTDLSSVGNPGHANAYSASFHSNGTIVVAGFDGFDATTFAVLRYKSDGTLDTSFGTVGIVRTSIGTAGSKAYSVAVDSTGRITVGGQVSGFSGGLVRYLSSGALDTSFNTTGKFTGSATAIQAIALTPSGKIVAAGYDSLDFLVERHYSSGLFDSDYYANGRRTINNSGTDTFYGLTILTNGRYCIAGRTSSTPDMAIYCLWQ